MLHEYQIIPRLDVPSKNERGGRDEPSQQPQLPATVRLQLSRPAISAWEEDSVGPYYVDIPVGEQIGCVAVLKALC